MGIQFETLFTDDLYMRIARHAVDMALQIKTALTEKEIPLFYDSYTNQQFPILTRAQADTLAHDFAFSHWMHTADEKTVIRLCTSWATLPEHTAQLCNAIRSRL